MKAFLGVILALTVSSSALAGSVDIDVNLAKATAVQSDDGTTTSTATTAATGAQLPSIKWNFDGYSLLADLNSKDVGAEYAACPEFKLGVTGGASTAKEAGEEKHDSKATVYVKTGTDLGDGKLEGKLSLSRQQAAGSLSSNGINYGVKWFASRNTLLTPYAAADVGYATSTTSDANRYTSSISLGVRTTLK